jgi:hypothetical protein
LHPPPRLSEDRGGRSGTPLWHGTSKERAPQPRWRVVSQSPARRCDGGGQADARFAVVQDSYHAHLLMRLLLSNLVRPPPPAARAERPASETTP